MPARDRLTELVERKRLILARAELHRRALALERSRWQEQWEAVHGFVDRHRWWLVGGAAAGAALLARRWRGLAGWLPAIFGATRALRRRRRGAEERDVCA